MLQTVTGLLVGVMKYEFSFHNEIKDALLENNLFPFLSFVVETRQFIFPYSRDAVLILSIDSIHS